MINSLEYHSQTTGWLLVTLKEIQFMIDKYFLCFLPSLEK